MNVSRKILTLTCVVCLITTGQTAVIGATDIINTGIIQPDHTIHVTNTGTVDSSRASTIQNEKLFTDGGRPRFGCRHRMPLYANKGGNMIPAQTTESPFTITVNPSNIHPGDTVEVSIHATGGHTFRAFLLQVTSTSQGTGTKSSRRNTRGYFLPSRGGTELRSCYGNSDTVVQGDVSKRSGVTVYWKSPSRVEDGFIVRGTFVEDYTTIWTNAVSPQITSQHKGNAVPEIDEMAQAVAEDIESSDELFEDTEEVLKHQGIDEVERIDDISGDHAETSLPQGEDTHQSAKPTPDTNAESNTKHKDDHHYLYSDINAHPDVFVPPPTSEFNIGGLLKGLTGGGGGGGGGGGLFSNVLGIANGYNSIKGMFGGNRGGGGILGSLLGVGGSRPSGVGSAVNNLFGSMAPAPSGAPVVIGSPQGPNEPSLADLLGVDPSTVVDRNPMAAPANNNPLGGLSRLLEGGGSSGGGGGLGSMLGLLRGGGGSGLGALGSLLGYGSPLAGLLGGGSRPQQPAGGMGGLGRLLGGGGLGSMLGGGGQQMMPQQGMQQQQVMQHLQQQQMQIQMLQQHLGMNNGGASMVSGFQNPFSQFGQQGQFRQNQIGQNNQQGNLGQQSQFNQGQSGMTSHDRLIQQIMRQNQLLLEQNNNLFGRRNNNNQNMQNNNNNTIQNNNNQNMQNNNNNNMQNNNNQNMQNNNNVNMQNNNNQNMQNNNNNNMQNNNNQNMQNNNNNNMQNNNNQNMQNNNNVSASASSLFNLFNQFGSGSSGFDISKMLAGIDSSAVNNLLDGSQGQDMLGVVSRLLSGPQGNDIMGAMQGLMSGDANAMSSMQNILDGLDGDQLRSFANQAESMFGDTDPNELLSQLRG